MTRTRTPRPAACTACDVTLRDKGGPTIANTRVHMGRGLCSACWKRDRYGYRPLPERPPACEQCGRGWDEVTYTARGMCAGCYGTQHYRETTVRVRQAMPETCESCSRTLRHKRAPATPGTVGYAGKGLCGACTNAVRNGRTRGVRQPRRPMPATCRSCSRTLRKVGTPKIPGTVVFVANGMCGSCYNADRAGTTVTVPVRTVPTECTSCERPMRAKTAPVAPGVVVHRARGLCSGCYVAEARRERQLLAFVLGGAQ